MNALCRTSYSLFFIFLMVSVTSLSAQNDFWEQCEGPEGAAIGDFTMTPDGSIYAFGSATYKSTDSGQTWNKTSDLGGNLIISDRDGTLYGASGWWLYRSTDGGNEWKVDRDIVFGGTAFEYGDEGASPFVMTKGGSLFAVDDHTMFRSQNGVWKVLTRARPVSWPDFRNLAADSLGNVLAGTNRGLYLINEASDTAWITLNREGRYSALAYSSAGYWLCAVASANVYDTCYILRTRQLDSTKTKWDTVYRYDSDTYASIHSIIIAPSGDIIALRNSSHIMRSSDNGTTWSVDSAPRIGRMLLLGDIDGMIATSEGAGPVRSSDGGRSWQNSSSGMNSLPIEELAVSPSGSLYVATTGPGIYRSTDRGITWAPAYDTTAYHFFSSICRTRKGSILAGTSSIYRSSDEGNSWQQVYSYTGDYLRMMTTARGIIYGYRNRAPMIRSSDDGATWDTLENSPRCSGFDWGRQVEDSMGTLWWHDWNGFIRSTDNGKSWDTTALADPAAKAIVWSMAVQPSGAIVAATDSGVIRSVDGGRTWVILSRERPGGRESMKMASVGDDNLFIADTSRSLFLSTNSGLSWRPVPIPSQHWNRISTIASDTSGYVYLATDKGVFRSREPQVLSSVPQLPDAGGELLVEYRDGIVMIRAEIEAAAPAYMTIITLDGRVICSRELDGRTTQLQSELTVPDLVAGVYICQIRTEFRQLQQKFAVIR